MKVLVAMDHSSAAREAARTAVALLPAAEIFVLSVSEAPSAWGGGRFGAVVPLQLDVMAAEAEDQRAALVAEDAQDAAGLPDARVEVTSGDVVHEICEAARRHRVDLIVVGSHDRSLLSRLLVPSISRGVIGATDRPVLVVPEPSS